jgi:hypothetical protein
MVNLTYGVAVRYVHSNQLMENVLHVNKITAGAATDAQFLAFANAWKEVIRAQQSANVTYLDWIATQVAGAGVAYDPATCKQVGGTVQSGLLTGTLIGGTATDPLPPMNTMSVQLRTGTRGRSYRSKLQLGSHVESVQSNGFWTVGYVAAIQANVDAFRAVYGSGGTNADLRWCTFSRGIASGCFPDPDQRHHPLVHRQAGDQDASIANIVSVLCGSVVTTTRSRI